MSMARFLRRKVSFSIFLWFNFDSDRTLSICFFPRAGGGGGGGCGALSKIFEIMFPIKIYVVF